MWKERPFASKAELTDWLWGSSDAGRVVMSSRRHSPRRGVGQTPRVHTAGLSEESELGAPDVGTGTDVTLGTVLGAAVNVTPEATLDMAPDTALDTTLGMTLNVDLDMALGMTLNVALGRDPEERGGGVAGGDGTRRRLHKARRA